SPKISGDLAAQLEGDGPTVMHAHGPSMRQTVTQVAGTFDVVVIDTPPRANAEEAFTALALADIALVPMSPGPADVWATDATVRMVTQVSQIRPELKVRLVLNRVDRRTAVGSALQDAAHHVGIVPLATMLGNRVVFPEAMASGRGVVTYQPSSAAADEVRELIGEIVGVLGAKTTPPPAPLKKSPKKAAKEAMA
ncbi:MAG: hypothetical protein ACO3JL_22060, partial [Myxococcota bacterium]